MGKERKGENIICKACNKEFYVPQYRLKTAKFCSMDCLNHKQHIKHIAKCQNCSKEFIITDYNKNRKYCSLSCNNDRINSTGGIFYFIYKTTNIINNKEYIGIHKTNNIEDSYIGNGISSYRDAEYRNNTPFAKAVIKYGYDNFKREILKFCSSYDELLEEEEKIVTLEYIKKETNYNIKVGGFTSTNLSDIKPYDLTDKNGIRYRGSNIKTFCNKMNLGHSGICRVVKGDFKSSQGFTKTENYTKEKLFIVVNLETNEIFKTNNLNKWCEENAPHLRLKKGNALNNVVAKRTATTSKKWWACKEEDWTGEVVFSSDSPRIERHYQVIDDDGNIYNVVNVASFCKTHKIDSGYFYGLLRGQYKKCKNFKMYTN